MCRSLLPPPFWNALLASSTRVATSTAAGETGRAPVSMRATSSRLPIRSRMESACSPMMRKNWSISAVSRSKAASVSVAADPLMAARGVRSSWLTMPRNSARSRSSSSIGVMSCMVTTTDSTSPPPPEKMGVALTRVVTLRPSGAWRTISSARTVSPVLSPWARGNSTRETSRPSARRKVSTSSSCSAEPPGAHRPLTIRLASRLMERTSPVPASRTRHAHGRGVHQGLQVGPGPLLLPVPAGVGDDQRRLGGEHHQGLLVFGGELQLLLADVEGPDALPQVADGRGQEGKGRAHRHRRAELGQAQLPDVAVEVPQSQRLADAAQVLEEQHPVGEFGEPPALLGSQPGIEEVLYPPRFV